MRPPLYIPYLVFLPCRVDMACVYRTDISRLKRWCGWANGRTSGRVVDVWVGGRANEKGGGGPSSRRRRGLSKTFLGRQRRDVGAGTHMRARVCVCVCVWVCVCMCSTVGPSPACPPARSTAFPAPPCASPSVHARAVDRHGHRPRVREWIDTGRRCCCWQS